MKKLTKKIQNFSHRYNLWKEGNKIIVGVSGGPDSVCLLDILVSLIKKRKFELIIAHVNYGLRKEDSKKDELFVKELANRYGLRIKVLNVKKLTKSEINENNLRDIRYDFFEKVRQENNFDLIAVAHNQDDQAETILMRLIRGSGLMGLGSIKPKNGKIIRPLLSISRSEILEYLKENEIKYRIDKTNKENIFLRNKIRNKLIPLLEKEYNLIIKETLASSASSIREDYEFISERTEKLFKKIKFNLERGHYFFGVDFFEKIHPALQKQVLRKIISKLRGDLLNIENNNLEEIIKITRSKKNKSQKLLFKGLKVERKGDIIYISTDK